MTFPQDRRLNIGTSVEGREITVHLMGSEAASPDRTLIIGGLHGDEIATILLLEDFLVRYGDSDLHIAEALGSVAVLPRANPDGCERRSRYNGRGVDLNRNWETSWSEDSIEPSGPGPWSEPETVALRDFIIEWKPLKIISLHWALAEIDADGVHSTDLARAMWEALTPEQQRPYRLRVTQMGEGLRRLKRTYAACPGSLGQWCGYGIQYPDGARPAMITLELPYDPSVRRPEDELPDSHLTDLRNLWRRDSQSYLRAVEPGVHAMLRTACAFCVKSR